MDFSNQEFQVVPMVEAVARTAVGQTVYMMTVLYPDTTISQISQSMGFVICKEKPKVVEAVAVEENSDPGKALRKKPGRKLKGKPKELPKDQDENKKEIDIPKIHACYTANPPRTPDWIADEMGLTREEVVEILTDLEIYRGD